MSRARQYLENCGEEPCSQEDDEKLDIQLINASLKVKFVFNLGKTPSDKAQEMVERKIYDTLNKENVGLSSYSLCGRTLHVSVENKDLQNKADNLGETIKDILKVNIVDEDFDD